LLGLDVVVYALAIGLDRVDAVFESAIVGVSGSVDVNGELARLSAIGIEAALEDS
jgi:hypothetical protein